MDIREYNPKTLPYHFVLFYEIPNEKLLIFGREIKMSLTDNAILTYCYLDSVCGMSYKVICPARKRGSEISYHIPENVATAVTLREGALECQAIVIDEDDQSVEQFKEEVDLIKKCYGYHLDSTDVSDEDPFSEFRHPAYPNDILVNFMSPDHKIEKMWVTQKDIREDGIVVAQLINEPYNALMGVHEGDLVEIYPLKGEDGETIPIAILSWMK